MLVTSMSLSSLSCSGLGLEGRAGDGGSGTLPEEGRMGDSWSGGGEKRLGFRLVTFAGSGVLSLVGKNASLPDGDVNFPLNGITWVLGAVFFAWLLGPNFPSSAFTLAGSVEEVTSSDWLELAPIWFKLTTDIALSLPTDQPDFTLSLPNAWAPVLVLL